MRRSYSVGVTSGGCVLAFVASLALGGCTPTRTVCSACDPGRTVACPCGGGLPDGTQTCRTDGCAYGTCSCGPAPVDAGTIRDSTIVLSDVPPSTGCGRVGEDCCPADPPCLGTTACRSFDTDRDGSPEFRCVAPSACGFPGDYCCADGACDLGFICEGAEPSVCGASNNCPVDGVPYVRACYSGPIGTAGLGECRAGTTTCAAGAWRTCVGETTPVPEICANGLDDNCDGRLDDGCGTSSIAGLTVAGNGHTCTALASPDPGPVRCWGFNGYGQLGDGTTVDRATSVAVSVLTAVGPVIGAGWDHTCAYDNALAGLYCWGANDHGQLGDGTTIARSVPVRVDLPARVIQVEGGWWHTCALDETNTVWCWGEGDYTGTGIRTTVTRPAPVAGLTGTPIEIAVGRFHGCARMADRTVRCWGLNNRGQVGQSDLGVAYLAAVSVPGLSGVAQIIAGGNHTCALLDDRTVRCWGDNARGQLGDGTMTDRSAPVAVVGLTGVSHVALGSEHSCAVIGTGSDIQCWGYDLFGQLGYDGALEVCSAGPCSTFPRTTAASGLGSAVVGGGMHTCVFDPIDFRSTWCWGDGRNGQLGDGLSASSATPRMSR